MADDARSDAARRLVLATFPGQHLPADLASYRVYVPNPRAAAALPGGIPFASLSTRSHAILRARDLEPADAFRQQTQLLRAVREQAATSDPVGTAAMMAPRVRELLRAGLEVAPLAEHALGPRTTTLLRVARRYRELLRERRADGLRAYFDPAEAAWEAARLLPPERRERLLVVGYPQVGRGEYALIEALAGPGSLVVLPTGNEAAVELLGAAGWAVELPEGRPRTLGERLRARFRGEEDEVGGGAGRGAADGAVADGVLGDGALGDGVLADGAPVDRAPADGVRPERVLGDGALADAARADGARAEDTAVAWRFPSQEAEVRHVLAEVKALLHRGVPAGEIVLATRDELAYGPLVQAIAWEYEIPVSPSYSVPLTQTRAGAWFAGLAAVLKDDAPFEATARFLAHPLGAGLPPDAWGRIRSEGPSGLARWRAFDPRLEHLAWPGDRAPRAAWGERLEGLVRAFRLEPRDLADGLALDRLRTAILWVAAGDGQPVSGSAFLDDVLSLLPLLTAPAAPANRGVALHTPLALYGTRFAHLFVLGVVEGVLPPRLGDDPALDLRERQALRDAGLAVDDVLAMVQREERSFEALLLTATGRVVLGVPDEIGGRAHLPSPFLERLGLPPGGPPPKRLASQEEARRQYLRGDEPAAGAPAQAAAVATALASDPVLQAARRAWQIERRRESGATPDAFDGVVGLPLDAAEWLFSASQLVALGQCTFRWFAQRRLRLAEPDERDDEVGPGLRGQLWHKTLELVLRHAREADDLRAGALAALADAFAEAERQVAMPASRAWAAVRQEHLEALRRVLRGAAFLPDDLDLVGLETSFHTRWRGLRVRGVVDRIDRTADGLRLWDYKTSGQKQPGAQDASGKATVDVQLPLYVEAAAPALFPGEVVAEALYFSLTRNERLPRVTADAEELDRLVARVRSALERGAFPVEPDVDQKACAYCDFDLVCRKGPRIERKRAARAAEAGEGPP